MDSRRSVPFPDDIAEVLDAMVNEHVGVLEPPVCGVMGVRG
jgi:hypothetical protein